MLATGFALGVIVGLVVAGVAAALAARAWLRVERERERARAAAQERQLDDSADALRDAFRALSAEGLARVEARLGELERARVASQAQLAAEVQRLAGAGARVADEAAELARALRAPAARGRWGELQLRRVVELAGLGEHVDFAVQEALGGEGGARRPDLVVRLPGGRAVAVDAKAPLDAYLAALSAPDPAARRERLDGHARAVRRHARALAQRGYARAVGGGAFELVVMFLPAEAALAAALEADPELLEALVGERVVVATPATLIALLHAVAAGWRESRAAEHAAEAAALGRELHARLRALAGHFAALRRGLDAADAAYRHAAGALETRVMASARRLAELGMSTGEALPRLAPAEPTASSWPDTSP
jgi:DNA recombination protein RmuC